MEYQYKLATHAQMKRLYGHRLPCPSCGRKQSFVVYVDGDGEPISTNVGKCDHINKCGYHYRPSEYRRDHPDEYKRRGLDEAPRYVPPIKRLPSYIDEAIVNKTLTHYEGNTLATWLRSFIPDDVVMDLMAMYKVGTARDGSVIYWQHDKAGKCRSGKVMLYDIATGHRRKDHHPGWAHSKLHLEDFNLEQCLFGLHLVPRRTDVPVCVFESEKTAMLGAIYINDYMPCVCVATGGAGNLTRERMLPLHGRDIVLWPDNGQFETWYDKADEMVGMFNSVRVIDIMEQYPFHEVEGDDIGDWIAENHSNTSTLFMATTWVDVR